MNKAPPGIVALAAFQRSEEWGEPDLSLLEEYHLPAPELPMEVFGDCWAEWIATQAAAKSCPKDYVAAGLLASTSVLIGNARWGQPWEGWSEPPVLWCMNVGTPSQGKSPGLDPIREVLAEIENETNKFYESDMKEWEVKARDAKVHQEVWEEKQKAAIKKGDSPPARPSKAVPPPKPRLARITVTDITVEKVARIMRDNPRGLILFRDELSGWIGGMERYNNSSDRPFWLESYGGRPYSVDRVKTDEPILIAALTFAIAGGIQPDKLDKLVMKVEDDGMASRFIYFWPEPVPFRRPSVLPRKGATDQLNKLNQQLTLVDGKPVKLPFCPEAAEALEAFMAQGGESETGMLLAWKGKRPGFIVRLAVVLEHLWWCGGRAKNRPDAISEEAVRAAVRFLEGYAEPMARRCFGDATIPIADRDAATLARWIMGQGPKVLNARALRRDRVLTTQEAGRYDEALRVLEEASWVRAIRGRLGGRHGRQRKDFAINPSLEKSDE